MKNLVNSVSRFCRNKSIGLLLLRIGLGVLFLVHGWSKIHNIPGTEMMFAHMGFPMWVGDFIAGLEVAGGIALILGIATRFFAALFGIEMLVAVLLNWGNISKTLGGVELLLAVASFGLAFLGSGRYSLYPMECDDCGGMICKPGSADCPGT